MSLVASTGMCNSGESLDWLVLVAGVDGIRRDGGGLLVACIFSLQQALLVTLPLPLLFSFLVLPFFVDVVISVAPFLRWNVVA